MIVGFCQAFCRVLLSVNQSTRQNGGSRYQQDSPDLSEMSGSPERREPQGNRGGGSCRQADHTIPQITRLVGLA